MICNLTSKIRLKTNQQQMDLVLQAFYITETQEIMSNSPQIVTANNIEIFH